MTIIAKKFYRFLNSILSKTGAKVIDILLSSTHSSAIVCNRVNELNNNGKTTHCITFSNQPINHCTFTRRRNSMSLDDDTEAPGGYGQQKTRWKRCPLSRRKNWGCEDDSLTSDGRLFQTVGAETRKARAAVIILVVGTISKVEFDDRRVRTGIGQWVEEGKKVPDVVKLWTS